MRIRGRVATRTTARVKEGTRAATGALLCSAMLVALAWAAPSASAAVTVTSHFIWTATSSNEIAGITLINNGATNGLPNALLFVTPTYDPAGSAAASPIPNRSR